MKRLDLQCRGGNCRGAAGARVAVARAGWGVTIRYCLIEAVRIAALVLVALTGSVMLPALH